MKRKNNSIKKVTILVFIVIFSLPIGKSWEGAAQSIDSLFAVWNDQSQHDTVRTFSYISYANRLSRTYGTDTAFKCLAKCYPIVVESGNKRLLGVYLNAEGNLYSDQMNFTKATAKFDEALAIFKELKDHKHIAWVYSNISSIYLSQSDFYNAIKYLKLSELPAKLSGDRQAIYSGKHNMATVYYFMGDNETALHMMLETLEFLDSTNSREKDDMALASANIGILYREQNEYVKAKIYLLKALKFAENSSNEMDIANVYIEFGKVAFLQNEVQNAKKYITQGLEVTTKLGDKYLTSDASIYYGQILGSEQDYKGAVSFCETGYALALEIDMIIHQRDACKCLYSNYKQLGDGIKALKYHELMLSLDDSLHREETQKQLQQMEFQKAMLQDSIATAEKERLVLESHQEEMRQEEKTRNIAIGGGLFFLLLSGGFYSRWRYVKKSRDIISKEKDRSENLLLNILPADIAEELKIHGKAEARDFDMVSILFTDFKGFTAASAKLSAQDLVSEINTCFEAFDGIMAKYNIEKIKTIGDAYMAAGGLPVPADDSVKNTVLAALEMQGFIVARAKELGLRNLPFFEMRLGIHTGPVVAGIVGVKKFAYDIWGDTVNTASRMESSGEVGQVNISQSTYELLKDDTNFSFESRGKIEAKGKGAIEMYFVSKA